MALSIIQGGPAPSFLASHVYEYIGNGISSIQGDWVSLVVDNHLKEAIEKVQGTRSSPLL